MSTKLNLEHGFIQLSVQEMQNPCIFN